MLRIRCPWCGHRDETEFRYGGQAHVAAPALDDDDETVAARLYLRANPAGPYPERWFHVHGCRRWFNLVRDTTTHRIAGTYLNGERPEDAR
ncbi:MAG: sarcosine oxidase subunit delta [Gemmatimonadales bacterium]